MGTYLEKNVQAFTDMQAKLTEQSKTLTPEMWAQFMNDAEPDAAGHDGQLRRAVEERVRQMQEQMQKQTEQMLGAFGIKRP